MTPEYPNTARRVESARGPVPAGPGRAPERSDGSTDELRGWASPQGGDPATGHGYRPPTPAGASPSGQRGQGPRCPTGRTDSAAVTRVLAARAVSPRVVPGPTPADAEVHHRPAKDVQGGGAPAWPPQRGLPPSPATLLGHTARG